ncbi:MAG: PAS domain S-box protein [Sphingosinicella sp.]|nr:PAS domain S-box protein [Sphingosinicella sp.]
MEANLPHAIEAAGSEADQLRRIIDLLPQMVWANENGGNDEFYNAKWLEFTGVQLGKGVSRFNLIHPEDRQAAAIAWDEAQETGRYQVEYRLRHHSGKYRWIISRGNASRDASGAITGWYGTCTDIEDKRGAMDALRRSETAKDHAVRRFHELAANQNAIFEAVDDGVLVYDKAGIIKRSNHAAGRIFGYTAAELVGKHIGILFEHAPSEADLTNYLETLAREGRRRKTDEYQSRRRDGVIFPTDVSTSPVYMNEALLFIAIVRDVSKRKQLEAMKNEFVSIVSHELRTPLTSIAGSLGLMAGGAAGPMPPKAERLVAIAHSNSVRLVRLVNDILDVEKMQSGNMQFDLRELNLNLLLAQIVEANLSYAAHFGVQLELAQDGCSATVYGDPDRLTQVFTNLISNAVKFSPQGASVTLSVGTAGPYARVTVRDTGPGIPDAFKPRIFGKFAQADSSDQKQRGGTGLGLSIVKEIVVRTGGEVSFESEVGQGTSFYVDLPPTAADADRRRHDRRTR